MRTTKKAETKKTSRSKPLNGKELDAKFDAGEEDILEHFDTEHAIRRVNVDFPIWMIKGLDAEAQRLGINRQALIKVWLGERLERDAV